MKRFEYKVPNGKLVRVKLEVEGGTISFIQLTGDFFMLPETHLEELEAKLKGSRAEPSVIEDAVTGFFAAKGTTMAGVSPVDFAYVIVQALRA